MFGDQKKLCLKAEFCKKKCIIAWNEKNERKKKRKKKMWKALYKVLSFVGDLVMHRIT